MVKHVKPNKVYYSNSDGEGARVTRELVSTLFYQLAAELTSAESLAFIEATRIPNERELYGTFVKALLNSELRSDLGYVATEFQVERDDADEQEETEVRDGTKDQGKAKGRVDLFFNYRKTSFLLELKVVRVGIGGETDASAEDTKANPKARVIKPWLNGVISQLEQLKIGPLSACLHQKVVKLPMVIYWYVDWRKNGPREGWEQVAVGTHERIVDDLSVRPPEFEYFTVFEQPLRTRKRRSDLGEIPDMSLYGFSLVAGTDFSVPIKG